jgi:hypothetical protein
MIARLRGILTLNTVPPPAALRTSTVPPRRSTLARTTSIPTPRPDTAVTVAAVENPA